MIGILLTEPRHLPLVQATLPPEDFEDPTAQAAYRAILALAQAGQVPDGFAVQSRLPSPSMAEQLWLWKADAIVANLQAAIQDIQERTAWRRCRQELTHLLAQYDHIDPQLLPDKLLAAATLLDRVFSQPDAVSPTRRPTGIPKLDEVLGGGWPSDAIIQLEGHHGSGRSRALEALLSLGTPRDHQSLLALTDTALSSVHARCQQIPQLVLSADVTTLPTLLLHARLRPTTQPFTLVGVDSVNGLAHPAPNAQDWRTTSRRLRAPLFLITNQMAHQSDALTTNADIVLSMRKNETAFQVHRNRFGPTGTLLSWADLKSRKG